jgi:hypothetical protein
MLEHLGTVSEVCGVENVSEEPREDEHDGARNVVGEHEGHRYRRTVRTLAERQFVGNVEWKRNLEMKTNTHCRKIKKKKKKNPSINP